MGHKCENESSLSDLVYHVMMPVGVTALVILVGVILLVVVADIIWVANDWPVPCLNRPCTWQ